MDDTIYIAKKRYKKCVYNYTKSNLKVFGEDYFGKDLMIDKHEFNLTVDHKFSVDKGFDLKIPASIISNLDNIQLLSKNDNYLKGQKCSITLEELFIGYLRFKSTYMNDIDTTNRNIIYINDIVQNNFDFLLTKYIIDNFFEK